VLTLRTTWKNWQKWKMHVFMEFAALFFVTSRRKVNGVYYWDILLSHRCYLPSYRPRMTVLLADVNLRSRSLYAIAVPSVCRLSVVCDAGAPYSAGWNFRQFFSPYDSPGTLVFWCQKRSWAWANPLPLKFALKVTHPLSCTTISINIGSYRLNRDS